MKKYLLCLVIIAILCNCKTIQLSDHALQKKTTPVPTTTTALTWIMSPIKQEHYSKIYSSLTVSMMEGISTATMAPTKVEYEYFPRMETITKINSKMMRVLPKPIKPDYLIIILLILNILMWGTILILCIFEPLMREALWEVLYAAILYIMIIVIILDFFIIIGVIK